ncbi:lyase family protein [Parashewanella tropica]|uniref:lyase family protein n=1 Tax=Parashewanella tropica TaxID=2547970 RepID=UPI001059A5CF|nr:lyase family protein [Parashewanella tropica]
MLHWQTYHHLFFDDHMNSIWDEDRTLHLWLDIEKTIAKHQAQLGLISADTALKLSQLKAEYLDRQALQEDMKLTGRPILGLVKQLKNALPKAQQSQVHFGLTTQDIMDTCTAIQLKRSLEHIKQTIRKLLTTIDPLVTSSSSITAIARTNGQYAMPMQLSQKFTLWQAELQRRLESINHVQSHFLWLQLSGSVGDSNAFGAHGKQLRDNVASELGLSVIEPHWQNARDGIAEIINSIGLLCSTLTKIAHNINLLSSSDIAEFQEVIEKGKGASSSMPHKRNQRNSEMAEAISRLARQHCEQMNELTLHQHQRQGGVWISEWYLIPQIFMLTSGALKWINSTFCELEINHQQVKSNLNRFDLEKAQR